MFKRIGMVAALALAGAAMCSAAGAADFPTRTITMVVPQAVIEPTSVV